MQGLPVTIRKALPNDAEAMFAVHMASVRELCAAAYSAEHIRSWFEGRTPDIYSSALAAERVWVAERQGQILGFVGAELGEVTLLFVAPEFAGQGIGRSLFEHGLAAAGTSPAEELTVVATRNSESFYAAYGFVAIEEQSFIRGERALQYAVIKMQRPGGGRAQVQRAATDA